jgi:hypothetical protein
MRSDFSGITRNDSWTGIPAFKETSTVIEIERSLELFRVRGVTFVAMFCEDRPDFLLEKFQAAGRKIFRSGNQRDTRNKEEESEDAFSRRGHDKET